MNPLYLAYAIILLQLGDFITTTIILRSGGVELNPLTAKIYKSLGIIPGLLLTKGTVIGLFAYYGEQFPIPILVAVIALYLYVVEHNIIQLRK